MTETWPDVEAMKRAAILRAGHKPGCPGYQVNCPCGDEALAALLGADTARLDWLDSLASGISIHGDAVYPQSMGMTPKERGFSHTRHLIDEARRMRESIQQGIGLSFRNNDHEHDGA